LNNTYTLEIDSVGKNFSKSQALTLTNVLQETYTRLLVKSFTGAEFNAILIKLGLKPAKSYGIQARVTSSFYSDVSKLVSNAITMTVTPYSAKPIPKIQPPASLFIVGDATAGGWSNPVPVPSQQFSQIDENTFGTIIQLKAGKNYLLLPENGSWDHKFAVADNSIPAAKSGGDLIVDAGKDFPAPATDGSYKIMVNFLTGKYAVTEVPTGTIPDSLYIVGDATPGGWTNPVPIPSQKFTKTNDYTFELTLPLTAGKEYLLLPKNGDWSHKYSVDDNTSSSLKSGGTFTADAPKNLPGPETSGTYKIVVSFLTNTFKLTKL
jgi:hypothetical protein